MISIFKGLFKKRGLEKKWVVNIHSPIVTPPVLNQDQILLGTKDGKLYSVDYSGKINWIYEIKDDFEKVQKMFLEPGTTKSIFSTPLIADINNDGKNEIIFGSNNSLLYCLSEEGKFLWKFKTNGAVTAQAFVHDVNKDGKLNVLIGSKDGIFYILDSKGWNLKRFKVNSPIECQANVLGDQILFGANDGMFYSVNFDGSLNWKFKTQGQILSQCSVGKIDGEREYIVFGSSDKNLYVLNEKGDLHWNYETNGRILGKAILKDINNDGKLNIFFGSCDDNVYALNYEGKKLWSYQTNFWVLDEPKLVDINKDNKFELIVGSYDGEIFVLDAEGDFTPDYVPGLSSIVNQSGHYSDLITHNVGQFHGKEIFKCGVNGMIIGSNIKNQNIFVSTNTGEINNLKWGE